MLYFLTRFRKSLGSVAWIFLFCVVSKSPSFAEEKSLISSYDRIYIINDTACAVSGKKILSGIIRKSGEFVSYKSLISTLKDIISRARGPNLKMNRIKFSKLKLKLREGNSLCKEN